MSDHPIFIHVEWSQSSPKATTVRGTRQQIYERWCQIGLDMIYDEKNDNRERRVTLTLKPEGK